GILNVAAKDLGTGKEAKITISASTKLSKEDKEKMVRDAEQYADQDKKKMEEAQMLNEADSALYTAEKTKTDLTGKISDEDVAKIDSASRDLRKAIETKDFGQVKSKSEHLRKVLQDVGTQVYQRAAQEAQAAQKAQGGGGQAPGSGSSQGPAGSGSSQGEPDDGNVTDASYKVMDEDKK
ncbi:MAG: Hsp70 family protein, partial [Nitrososphaerales archaeon]